jgi:uncharacterized protein (DUF58 family)
MSVQTRSRFLDLRAIAALERMRFVTRQRVEGAYSGRHQSRQQGGAGEFVDFREYSGAEDLRRLDWKVLARTGKSFLRLYQEETNLACTIAMDASESMRFGDHRRGHVAGNGRATPAGRRQMTADGFDGSKLQYAQYLATAMSYIIGRGQDQVGLAILDESLRELFPPSGTVSHVARLHEAIEQMPTRRTTVLAPGLRTLFERSRRRGVLLLMTDFLMDDLEAVFATLRLFRHRQWEVVVLHLVHPDEERLPEGSAFRFEGMEDGGHVLCTPREIVDSYQTRFAAHLASVRQLALAVGCDYRLVSTAVSYLDVLGGFLIERSG